MHAVSSTLSLPEAACTPVGSEVYRGLTSRPKTLCPWLFYDQRGSELFEAITELPEYYLTRTERAIFAEHGDEMIAAAAAESGPLTMIELGAGTATKTGLLLRAAIRSQGAVDYYPIDVSASALAAAEQHIAEGIPGVRIESRVGDYTRGIEPIPCEGRRLVLYIGSSIGNFEPADAVQVLREARRILAPGDHLLLGADRAKDASVLIPAYDDAAGVTADFNKNVLTRIHRELGADFNLRTFRHRARWNREQSRIEMHLESLIAQTVSIPALHLEVRFARGETIHTENSYKFTPESIASIIERAGFALTRCWSDPRQWFGVYLATAV